MTINSLRPRQNDRYFADDIFKCILLNENFLILDKISLKYVPYGLIDNIASLVQIMAWRRPGDKPLSEPTMYRLPTHICVTQPQWVNLENFMQQILVDLSARDTASGQFFHHCVFFLLCVKPVWQKTQVWSHDDMVHQVSWNSYNSHLTADS